MQPNEQNQWRVDVWTALKERLEAQNPPFLPLNPLKQKLYLYDKANKTLYLEMAPKDTCIYCALWLQGADKDFLYDSLCEQNTDIEEKLGTKLDWQRIPGQRSGSIRHKKIIDPKEAGNRDKVIDWFSENTIPFYNAFKSRIDVLAESLLNQKRAGK